MAAARQQFDEERKLEAEEKFYTPSAFCPITYAVMKDPWVDSEGYSFEGEAIFKWREEGGIRHPVAGVDMQDEDLYPNRTLKKVMHETSTLIKELYQKIDKLEKEKKSALVDPVLEAANANLRRENVNLQEINAFLKNSNHTFQRENEALRQANTTFQLEIRVLQEQIMKLKDISERMSEELRRANINTLRAIQEELAIELKLAEAQEELASERSKMERLAFVNAQRNIEAPNLQEAKLLSEHLPNVQQPLLFRERVERAPDPLPAQRLNQAFLDAVRADNLQEAKRCLDAGANVNVVEPRENSTALIIAAARNLNPRMSQMLLNYNPNLNSQDRYGDTALHYAVKNYNVSTVKLLINHQARYDLRNAKGLSASDLGFSYLPTVWPEIRFGGQRAIRR